MKDYKPEQISAIILGHMADAVRLAVMRGKHSNRALRAVVTVPARFDEPQREATRAAGAPVLMARVLDLAAG